jgi:hypothetical protein
VERADQAPVLDPAPVPEMCTKVGTPGVPDMSFAAPAAPEHELMTKTVDGCDIGIGQLVQSAQGEPAVWHRERK